MFRFVFRISILVIVLSACSNDDNNNSNYTIPGNIPTLITLNYPSDFPFSLQISGEKLLSLQPIIVNGLASDLAYELNYASISPELIILAMNNSTSGGFFCGEQTKVDNGTVCTGTPNGNSIALGVSNASGINQQVTIDIVPSSTLPWISQGSESNPLQLSLGVDFPFDATVGTAESSYYQFNNLIPGAKYQVDFSKNVETINMDVFYDRYSVPADCELRYFSSFRCVFVSNNDFATVRIDSSPLFGGAAFTLTAQLLSRPEEFEGTWYQPRVLDYSAGELPHVAIIDDYSNYYQIVGLTTGRKYTIQYTSKTIDIQLKYYDSATGSFVTNIDCTPDNRNLFGIPDGGCTFTAVAEGLFIKANTPINSVGGGRFIIKLTPEPINEGSLTSPIQLVYDGSILRYAGQVADSKSYYRISGISPASEYMIRLAGDAIWQNTLTVYDGDNSFSSPSNCTLSDAFYCIMTVITGDLYISVNGVTSPPGRQFTLNITAPPVQENLSISMAGNVPYAGQVGDFSSRYTFSGLLNNTNYIARLSGATGDFRMAAWQDTSTTENCFFSASDMGGCLLNSGPNGTVLVSVRNGRTTDPGGHYVIDFTPSPQLSSVYQSLDVVTIPDIKIDIGGNGISSQLTVSNSLITSIKKITVEVFVEHGSPYDLVMQLIAPNGDTVMLVTQQAGNAYINTRFSDYADSSILTSSGERYNKAFRPATPLYLLNDNDANGIWVLKIADTVDINAANSKGGILHGWGLSFE